MQLVPLAESLHLSLQFCLQENLLNLFYQYSKRVWVDLREEGGKFYLVPLTAVQVSYPLTSSGVVKERLAGGEGPGAAPQHAASYAS